MRRLEKAKQGLDCRIIKIICSLEVVRWVVLLSERVLHIEGGV